MATVLDSIKRYQYIIENCAQDEHKVLKCINRLFNLNVTVQHLQETGVGRTINALRKEPGEVGPAARSLVQKWKEMVAAEESEEEGYQSHETSTHNGHGSGRESDDNGRQDTRSHNTNATSKVNGHHSGIKREYRSSEEDESNVKRSKYNYDDYTKKESKIKQEETIRIKREEPVKIKTEPPDSDSNESDEGDSGDTSESSVEHQKSKKSDKKESSSNHKSSKHSTHTNHNDHKRESSSSKTQHQIKDKSHHTEKHAEYHSSRSKERYSSDKPEFKDKTHSSHKHKSSSEKDLIPDKKHKSDYKSSDSKISSKESKSSSKHSKSDDNRSHKQETSDKHKSSSEKHSSKSDKHSSSSRVQSSEKEKQKHSEAEMAKHKSKEVHSSSKDKHRSSSKEKPKDKSSSKDKSSNHSEKHASSDSKTSSSEHKSKSERHESSSSGSSAKKSKHKSSSSSEHKHEKTSSKTHDDVPKKKDPIKKDSEAEDSEDGIDCGSGASFAEALGMISPVKSKKKPAYSKDIQSPNSSFSNDLSPASLLAPTAKLAPLPAIEITSLPEISPNYRPRPQPKALPNFTDEDALNAGISSKNQRTKVYSGNKVMGKIPSLYEMCVHILQEHIDALEFTGGVPYTILKPVVDRATPQQLFTLEHFNPYLMEDTDHLWQKFCEKSFRNKQRREMETWREMYLRCQEEQEHRLKSLTANIKIAQEAKKAPIKQTKMAYVDTVVKPPRNVARKQALHGTAHASTASPAARVASLASAPGVARAGTVRPPPPTVISSSQHKPKKAPLMQKALQFMRGRKR